MSHSDEEQDVYSDFPKKYSGPPAASIQDFGSLDSKHVTTRKQSKGKSFQGLGALNRTNRPGFFRHQEETTTFHAPSIHESIDSAPTSSPYQAWRDSHARAQAEERDEIAQILAEFVQAAGGDPAWVDDDLTASAIERLQIISFPKGSRQSFSPLTRATTLPTPASGSRAIALLGNGGNGDDENPPPCDHCGSRDHLSIDCDQKPSADPNSGGNNGSGNPGGGGGDPCQICNDPNHNAKGCPKRFEGQQQPPSQPAPKRRKSASGASTGGLSVTVSAGMKNGVEQHHTVAIRETPSTYDVEEDIVLLTKDDRALLPPKDLVSKLDEIAKKRIPGKPIAAFPLTTNTKGTSTEPLENCHTLRAQLDSIKGILKRYDMFAPFMIVFPAAKTPEEIFQDRRLLRRPGRDLFDRHHGLTAYAVGIATVWYKRWAKGPAEKSYIEDLSISLQIILNNLEATLSTTVKQKHDQFPSAFHGGPLALFISLTIVSHTSQDSMKNLVSAIEHTKISKVPGENVTVVTNKLRSGIKLLKSASETLSSGTYFPDDFTQKVLIVLQSSTVETFNRKFREYKKTTDDKEDVPKYDHTGHTPNKHYEAIEIPEPEMLLNEADNKYTRLKNCNRWKPRGSEPSANALERSHDENDTQPRRKKTKNLGEIRGKTVRTTPPAVAQYIAPLPTYILKQYTSVTLGMDILYVNRVPFLQNPYFYPASSTRRKGRRDTATVDLPGAFMQSDIDELIHVRLTGPLARLMAKVNPNEYEQCIEMENGKEVFYLKLKKALYGTLQAALMFWKDLTAELHDWGFELNPYDECVANKDINGSQCTILWHVDDLKISHVDPEVVSDMIRRLNKRYGTQKPLTETRGKVHTYLGMTIDYSVDGKVKIRMEDYVEEVLDEARPDMDGYSNTPAAKHLFEIRPDPVPLSDNDREYFHSMVAKLLFLGKRARPDIQEAVAFLTTRVKKPDEDDYKKLCRVIRYLRTTPTLCLTLEADDTHVVKWWVDASFAVHQDMRSHTGATMTLGKGSAYSASLRQKLTTTSSTEAELVGVSDVMPMVLWTRYFLEAQGYAVNGCDIFQDNQSAMLLEKNGKKSSTKRTRHINIRYFFVTDRVKAGEVDVKYCPTDEMTADFFTKPLLGAKFIEFRHRILNLQEDAPSTMVDVAQECVED